VAVGLISLDVQASCDCDELYGPGQDPPCDQMCQDSDDGPTDNQ
jgi:hypothetical protein